MYVGSDDSDSDEWDMGPLQRSKVTNSNHTTNGFSDDWRDPKERLISAINNSDLEEVKNIIKNCKDINIDSIIGNGGTALMYACAATQSHIVEYLVKEGANINMSHLRNTALFAACSNPSCHKIATVACVKVLLDNKAQVNICNMYGVTPLMKAIMNEHDDVALMLLRFSDLDMLDSRGWKASFYAADKGNAKLLRKLLHKGSSLKDVDKLGHTLKALTDNSSEEVKEVVEEFASQLEDDETYNNYEALLRIHNKWEYSYPDLCNEAPEYAYDVFQMLYGMNSESLIPTFEEARVSLREFLMFDEDDLTQIGVVFPFQRQKILQGLYKFHLRSWKRDSVAIDNKKGAAFDIIRCLEHFASHRKQIVVIKCNLLYLNKLMVKDFKVSDDEFDNYLNTLNKNIRLLNSAVKNVKEKIIKLHNITDKLPPDYVTRKEKYIDNRIKNKILNCSLTVLSLTFPGLLVGSL